MESQLRYEALGYLGIHFLEDPAEIESRQEVLLQIGRCQWRAELGIQGLFQPYSAV